ncbi:MAG: diguanylate cyclase [Magnetococcales bacterium]|nr:diguanylate cyclase [Magnetococcales bacterium]
MNSLSLLAIPAILVPAMILLWQMVRERNRLKKNIQDLQLAQEIAFMGNWDWDLTTDSVTATNRLGRIFGVDHPGTGTGDGLITQAIHPGDRIDVMQCRRQARQDPRGQWSIRYRVLRPDGAVRMVREHGRTLTDNRNQPVRLLATVADVTHIYDMEKREERVIQSQIALSALLETGLEPLSLEKQLQVAMHIILTVPWLSVKYQGSIFLLDEVSGDLVLFSQVGLSPEQVATCTRVKPGFCLCGRAVLQREIVFASQIDKRHDCIYPGMEPHGHYCVPILLRSQLLGVLNLYVPHGYEKNREEDAFLTTIGKTLAGLIDHRRTEAKLRNEQEFIATVLKTAPSLVVVLDAGGEIILFNHACQSLTGYTEREVIGQKIWDFLVPENEVESLVALVRGLAPGERPIDHEGHWLTRQGDPHLIAWSCTAIASGRDGHLHIIATGVDISEKRQVEQRLQFLASHDPLTGLPNRMQFMEHLTIGIAQARRSHRHLAVVFLDLDRFKSVNDTLGHEVGDRLLTSAAQRIRSCVREMDVVARLGGDEFTVLMTGLADIEPIAAIAHKIVYHLQQPFEIGPHRCQIGTSIGISLFPDHGEDPQVLLKKADMAMYRVKDEGRNNFKIWDEGC